MTKKGPRAKRYLRSRITHKLILDTAQQVFLEKGYAKTTITKISQEAGVGYGTVYSHFKGKEDLLNKIVDHVMESFMELLEKSYTVNHCSDLYHIFYRQINSVFALATENRAILKVLREALGQSEIIKEHWEKVLYSFVNKTARLINTSHKKGLTRNINAEIASKALIFMVESFFWEVVQEDKNELETLSDSVTRLFLEGLAIRLELQSEENSPTS